MDHVQILSFQPCAHCRQIYYLFILFRQGREEVIQGCAVSNKQDAFGLLNSLRISFLGQVEEKSYQQTGREIACSALPEYRPDDKAARLIQAHHSTPEARTLLEQSIKFLHRLVHYEPGAQRGS